MLHGGFETGLDDMNSSSETPYSAISMSMVVSLPGLLEGRFRRSRITLACFIIDHGITLITSSIRSGHNRRSQDQSLMKRALILSSFLQRFPLGD